MSTHELIARIHQEDDGTFWADVVDLPGCFASGENLDELREALEEAISLYLDDEPGQGAAEDPGGENRPDAPTRPMEIGEMRVKVPA
jgi:predicted RNase H-like HicB family nuclease